MKEYIEREALKQLLVEKYNFFPAIVKNAIDEMPAADVVSGELYAQVRFERDYVLWELGENGGENGKTADLCERNQKIILYAKMCSNGIDECV